MITFKAPLPPPSLRANSRAHWGTKSKDRDTYSRAVYGWAVCEGIPLGERWEKASASYIWCYAGARPDIDNVAAAIKTLQDIMCVAPELPLEQAQKYQRLHLGLVADDNEIDPITFEREKVQRRAAEGVVVTLIRR